MYRNKKSLVRGFLAGGLAFLALLTGCRNTTSGSLSDLNVTGTRSWIGVKWTGNEGKYEVYWSEKNERPCQPGTVVDNGENRFYIQGVKEDTKYYVWVMPESQPEKMWADSVITVRDWQLEKKAEEPLYPASSVAVPEGMELYWQDEFNEGLLNRNKWSTNYYSNWDFMDRTNWEDFRSDNLPQPAMVFTDTTIRLITNDSLPERNYWASGRKISSIQTFDWNTCENHLDNSRGGYFEARVRRHAKDAEMVNTAFWFDSPGPDLKYYLEAGDQQFGVTGIRPHGQVFEIDVFEYLNAEIVLHGNVAPTGEFRGNIGHFIVKDERFQNEWVTHGMLWTPSGLHFYVNGKLKAEWTDPRNIKSPDHFMNVFLGAYGKGGEVEMEVDYIRYYQWPLAAGNELPNADFEYSKRLMPWEGKGTIVNEPVYAGKQALLLSPGDTLSQYVYVRHGKSYELSFWEKGEGKLYVEVRNLKPVTSQLINNVNKVCEGKADYGQNQVAFTTPEGREDHMQTIQIVFVNQSGQPVVLDDMRLEQK